MSLKQYGNIKMLLVEDDAFNIQLIRSLLAKISHFDIVTVDNCNAALDILDSKEHHIDIVLLDLHLPGEYGSKLLRMVRNSDKYNELPIIIISVDGINEDELLTMGANDFILKPFDIDVFASKLALHL
jgi:two-component system chemotaxis sensor kinase CheA